MEKMNLTPFSLFSWALTRLLSAQRITTVRKMRAASGSEYYRSLTTILLIALGSICVSSCSRAAAGKSVCDLLSHPNEYNGRKVTIHAGIISSFHGVLAMNERGEGCNEVIAINVPENKIKSKVGKIIIGSMSEPGDGYHVAFVTGVFKSYPKGILGRSNVKGSILVDGVTGWTPAQFPIRREKRGQVHFLRREKRGQVHFL